MSETSTATQPYSLGYKFKNILRVMYTLPFVLASLTGAAFALTVRPDYLLAFLIPLDVFFLALFVNLSNDYFDHKSGTDKVRFRIIDQAQADGTNEGLSSKTYWQGNSFDRGLITDRGGKILLAIIVAAAILVAIPIVYLGGWLVIVLGAVGFFLSYFYTAPPLNLGARGLGEVDVAVSFAFISFFTYFVMVQQFSWPMLLIAATVGLNIMLMRIIDEMSGLEAHIAAGEKDLVVRLGIDGVTKVVQGVLVAMYLLCAVLTFFDWTFALLFLTLPLGLGVVRYLKQREEKFWIMRPVLEIFKLAQSHMLLVIVALILQSAVTFAL